MSKKEEDYVDQFNKDREIISQFMIIHKVIKQSINGKSYIELILLDKTGEIKGRMFTNNVKKTYENIKINHVHNINGKIQEFPPNSKKYNLLIKTINQAIHYEDENFKIPTQSIEENIIKLQKIIKQIKNPEFKKIINSFFDDEKFTNSFYKAPAAKFHHHNFQGGLLVHTIEVASICDTISLLYPQINRDLLITGAILHDIGKIESYNYENHMITINSTGQLLDHLYISAREVDNKCSILNINKETKEKLIHMILSHHGNTELGWGSTIDPKIPEAVALHQADDMSAKIRGILKK